MAKITITARRCTRCGVVLLKAPDGGLCSNCTAWKAKQEK